MAGADTNPIIPGFAPDPSLVKVGTWYFLVNSTFHMFPGLPIYASEDLISWKHIGNAIHRRSQLSLQKSDTNLVPISNGEVMLTTGGLYAPTIRYKDGTFYVVCTNIIHQGGEDISENFVVTTKDIWAGEWSDLVYFEFKGIDPSILFDDDGKTYIQGSAGPGPWTTINQFEIDLATGEKLSEERVIWRGTGGIYPEGPHMYKRGGWYYLLISEGGTFDDHMITMARSRDIWGPFEGCPENPILTAKGTDRYIQYTGHCEAFDDGSGQWWGVCLGVRKDTEGRFIMGRESFLTRGNWDGEWLSLEPVMPQIAGFSPEKRVAIMAEKGEDYLYIRDVNLDAYEFADGSHPQLTMTASPVDLSHPEASPTFVGKRQRTLTGQCSAVLRPLPSAAEAVEDLKCGLTSYKDEHRYVRVFYDAVDSAMVFGLVNKAKKIERVERRKLDVVPSEFRFSIEYTEKEYRFLYSDGSSGATDGSMATLAVADTLDMTGPDFVGPVFGVFAVASTPRKVEVSELTIHT